jgi:hypothetical protein
MDEVNKFEFDRSRGIIWVCDVIESSKYLNDDDSVSDLEQFLPRLYWISNILVETNGCHFLKWTGDGFLAWCPVPLYRELGEKASAIILASFTLGALVNITQLGINTKKKIRIRHSLVFENDAILITITHNKYYQSLDLIGRSVVLAFRLCGIPSSFPNIVTQREIVEAVRINNGATTAFTKRNFVPSEIERFFKGEKWGTKTVYISSEKVRRPKSSRSMVRQIKKIIHNIEVGTKYSDTLQRYSYDFVRKMLKGPQWCRNVMNKYNQFLKLEEKLIDSVKKALPLLEKDSEKGLDKSNMKKSAREIK